jgi:hypothetical protein
MEPIPTYDQVIASKTLDDDTLHHEFNKLVRYKPKLTSRCFAGNSILYHFQLDNLCRVKPAGAKQSFYNMMQGEERSMWWEKVLKYAPNSRPNEPALRFYEVYRRLTGPTVFFKPTIAMNIYSQVKATHVLDPTAGWGGRMLGALAMKLKYTGIDTNTDLKDAYDGMSMFGDFTMIWEDALKVDFAEIDYDCVLTSPPYINLEVYPHMTPWDSKRQFYADFLIPLITKCRTHIKRDGKVCFNISTTMYDELLVAGYEPCKEQIPMLQQKIRGKDKADMVYVW